MEKLKTSLRARRGATAVEYLVMLILCALVVLGMIKVFGGTVKEKYTEANQELTLEERDRAKGDNLGPTASYSGGAAAGGQKGGSKAGGSASSDGSSDERGGSDKAKAKNSQAFADGASPGGSKGAGGGRDDDKDGSASDGKDSNVKEKGSDVQRRGAGKKDGSSINPIIIVAALLLLGLLFYVMSSGKD